jgi:KDO2-lipid IV(A) lauroyltransferase
MPAPVYWLCREALGRLPRESATTLAWLLFRGVHLMLRARRQENLRCLLDARHKATNEVRSAERRYLRFQGRLLAEVFRLMRTRPEDVNACASLEGEDSLSEALQEGRGVMLLGAHFGNWYFVPLLLRSKGYSFTSVVSHVVFPPLERDLQRLRKRFDIRVSFVGCGSSETAAAAFARNEVFATLIDVSVPNRKSTGLAFGAATMQVDLGPARLALRHRVPVLMALSHPEPKLGCACVRLFRLPKLRDNDTPESVTLTWLHHLHERVFLHPEHWSPLGFVPLSASQSLLLEGSGRLSGAAGVTAWRGR